jgi:small subunit ribosomal protein S4e
MSEHLKRLRAPDSWHIAKKTNKFITKTVPGPHNANAMPVAVWLRDHKMGIGIFDIISLPKIGKHYRILRNKKGRHKTIEIDAESAKTRLAKIRGKTTVSGGKVQLNLRYGANILADNRYNPGDSVVISLQPENRFSIIDHFPFAIGNMAMVIGGRHSGRIARITGIHKVSGSVPNRVTLEEMTGSTFETIPDYIYMVGREVPALTEWGIEE